MKLLIGFFTGVLTMGYLVSVGILDKENVGKVAEDIRNAKLHKKLWKRKISE